MEIPTITAAEWNDSYVHEARPCLIVDGMRGWPALGKWTPDYLRSVCGRRPVPVQVSRSGKWRYNLTGFRSPAEPSSQYRIPSVPFELAYSWIVNTPETGTKYYVSELDVRRFPDLLRDLRFSGLEEGRPTNMWFGSAHTVSPLHYDRHHNYFGQAYGSKRVMLFDPADTERIYPSRDVATSFMSPLDPEIPDLDAYPAFADADPAIVTVNAGQILFMPAFWWHHVRALDISISVSHWRPTRLEECRGVSATTYLLNMYQQDGWCGLRMANKEMTRERLLDAADTLVKSDPAIAAIAATVVAEDVVRWPPAPGCEPATLPPPLTSTLQSMLAAVAADGGRHLTQRDVAAAIGEVRAAVEREARALA